MGWVITPSNINPEFTVALENEIDFYEKDGYEVDFEVKYFDDYADLEVEVYVDHSLAGAVHHFDDIPHVIDRFFEEGGDN